MNGLAALIIFFFSITFGPPIIFLIAGLAKHRRNRRVAKIYYILGTVWLIIGGGMCASIMAS